jgi:hypothetical protein
MDELKRYRNIVNLLNSNINDVFTGLGMAKYIFIECYNCAKKANLKARNKYLINCHVALKDLENFL